MHLNWDESRKDMKKLNIMNKNIQRSLIYGMSLLTLAGCGQLDEEIKPNIIYVLADDLGYGDVGSFNADSKIKTPNIDQLAGEGMIFTDAHSSSSVCTPTRYSLLTGRYNWRTWKKKGVIMGTSPALIKENRETVASLLKKSGYYTGFIGKWHLGWNWSKDSTNRIDFTKPITRSPNSNGFDYAFGHCGSLDMAPYVYVENEKPTALPIDTIHIKKGYGFLRKGLIAPDFDLEDVTPNFFRRAIKFISEKSKSEKPFFLYLPLPSPHTPILPTEEWKGKSGLNPYGDFVMMVDAYMGELMKAVEDAGIEENTLIIFTSDNGCSPAVNLKKLESKGHNPSYIYRGHKADIFEGGHRIPFIAKWPNLIEAGTKCDQTICLIDLIATCASIVNVELAENAGEDSFDLMPLFKNSKSTDYLREATVHHSIDGQFAIRKGDWKYIFCPGSGGWSKPNKRSGLDSLPPFQLYNLKNDPGEKVNLYSKHPEIEMELKQLLTDYINNGRSTAGKKQENDKANKWPQIDWIENSKK